MKARVKATGRIIEVVGEGIQNSNMVMAAHGEWFTKDELDIVPLSWKPFEPTYWQKLEHQYAGMAMNALLLTNNIRNGDLEGMRECNTNAMAIAHALVEELKSSDL